MGESHIFRFNNPQKGKFKVFFSYFLACSCNYRRVAQFLYFVIIFQSGLHRQSRHQNKMEYLTGHLLCKNYAESKVLMRYLSCLKQGLVIKYRCCLYL